MVDMILDAVFPIVFLAVPTLAVIYLAGFIFGKAETVAAVKTAGVVIYKALHNLARRLDRSVKAFVNDTNETAEMAMEESNFIVSRMQTLVEELEERLTTRAEEHENALAEVEKRLADKISSVELSVEQLHDRLDDVNVDSADEVEPEMTF